MGAFYIQTETSNEFEEIYELNSTTDVEFSFSGELSSYKMESGFDASDNYHQKPKTVRFSGTITSVVPLSDNDNLKSTKEYIESIESIFDNKQSVTVFHSNELQGLSSCFFTSFSAKPKSLLDGSRAYKVSFELVQARITSNVREDIVVDPFLEDLLQQEETNSGSTSVIDDLQKESRYTQLVAEKYGYELRLGSIFGNTPEQTIESLE